MDFESYLRKLQQRSPESFSTRVATAPSPSSGSSNASATVVPPLDGGKGNPVLEMIRERQDRQRLEQIVNAATAATLHAHDTTTPPAFPVRETQSSDKSSLAPKLLDVSSSSVLPPSLFAETTLPTLSSAIPSVNVVSPPPSSSLSIPPAVSVSSIPPPVTASSGMARVDMERNIRKLLEENDQIKESLQSLTQQYGRLLRLQKYLLAALEISYDECDREWRQRTFEDLFAWEATTLAS